MKHTLKMGAVCLLWGGLSLSLGSVVAQDTPTPPWNQATVDAAIHARMTETANAADLTPAETPAPGVINPPRLNAENFDQIEPLAEHMLEGDLITLNAAHLKQEEEWLFFSSTENSGMTVWLIDRSAENHPVYTIRVPRYRDGVFNSYSGVTEVIDHTFYLKTDNRTLQFYDLNTGELINEIESEAEFETFGVWDEGNAIVGFMATNEVLVWDRTTTELINRWPTPGHLINGTVLSSGYALTTHRGSNVHAIDLRTGATAQSWLDVSFDRRDNLETPGQFELITIEDELLVIDNNTLETTDRISLPVVTLFGHQIAGTPFVAGVVPGLQSYIYSDEVSPAVYETVDGLVDVNQQGDLMIVSANNPFDKPLYQITESGLERLSFPPQIPAEVRLSFLGGDQLISLDSSNRQYLTVTLWGIP